MDLSDSWAIVTGAGRRIGRAIALGLAERGADIVVHCNRSTEQAQETAALIQSFGRKATIIAADQMQWSAVERACQEAWKETNGIDVLVNNAAIYRRTPLAAIAERDWDELLDTNLKGSFAFARFLGPRMKERGRGKIINVADVGAERIWPAYLPYCIAKAGIVAMTRGLARALAPEVQVNAVAPGTILWPEGFDEERKERLLKQVPLRRAGTLPDIVRAVCFLAESADYTTGAVLPVEGGRLIR